MTMETMPSTIAGNAFRWSSPARKSAATVVRTRAHRERPPPEPAMGVPAAYPLAGEGGIVDESDLGEPLEKLIGNVEIVSKIKLASYIGDDVGELTLKDIVDELKKPGRDPRPGW